ncbi:hypothetical protein ACVMHY_006593 [Bradyrhizobium barranii subsp. barranii]
MRDSFARQRRKYVVELASDDRDLGAAVFGEVRDLSRLVHGIDGHDHGVRPHHRVVGDDILRRVLQRDHDAIAALHAASVLQEAGQGIDPRA